ncbi:MAG: virulence RhuM family protein [Lentisphaerae bacterium]|jgi:hypothetical protein|nr:virulence RhuM family protein [Lentisphaerota bacterium]
MKKRNDDEGAREGQVTLYRTADGAVQVQCLLRDETLWLTQKAMGELFGVKVPAISKHLTNIFESGELDENRVVSILETTAADGKPYQTRYYNLDAIIAVGYRVNSYQATQFRIWATRVLKEYMIKGFVLDDERLKQGGKLFGVDYFEELLERIREIRASERRFYQKITDIYALSADFDPNSPITKTFFATVQNKLHWAITGKTAAETIHDSADASLPNMGLTTWKRAPRGKVLKSDVTIAKNHLNETQIRSLNRIVSAYLDLAENRAERRIPMNMADWEAFLNQFLDMAEYPVLQDSGRVSALEAKLKAEAEYEVFRARQDREFVSDFDREVRRLTGKGDSGRQKGQGDEG